MKTQLSMFLGGFAGNPARSVSGSELFVVAGSGNKVRDILANIQLTPNNRTQRIVAAAVAYAQDIGGIVDTLQANGAQHILVVDTPNFGLTPSALSFGPQGSYFGFFVSSSMNTALAARLAGESGVINFDFHALLMNTIADVASLGFTNVNNACGRTPVICDSATSLFYDGINPTTFSHTLLAKAVFVQVVPEPASYLLMGSGPLVLVRLRRHRKAELTMPAVLA